MPKMSDLEVLRTIESDAEMKAVPVGLLTSSRQERDIREGYDYVANAYVVKPVHFGEFIEAMNRLGAFWATVNEPPVGSKKLSL